MLVAQAGRKYVRHKLMSITEMSRGPLLLLWGCHECSRSPRSLVSGGSRFLGLRLEWSAGPPAALRVCFCNSGCAWRPLASWFPGQGLNLALCSESMEASWEASREPCVGLLEDRPGGPPDAARPTSPAPSFLTLGPGVGRAALPSACLGFMVLMVSRAQPACGAPGATGCELGCSCSAFYVNILTL